MTGPTVLLDPTAELAPLARALHTRPESLDGLCVGILDIAKARGNIFLDRVSELLGERQIAVKRYRKPTFTRPAPDQLRQQIAAECNVVVEGLAD